MNVDFSEGSRGGPEKTETGNLCTLDPHSSSGFRAILGKFGETAGSDFSVGVATLVRIPGGRPAHRNSRPEPGRPPVGEAVRNHLARNGQPVPSQP